MKRQNNIKMLCAIVMILTGITMTMSGCGAESDERTIAEIETATEDATLELGEEDAVIETEATEENENISIEDITESYYMLLQQNTDETIVDILVDDFENDGTFAAFAITSANYSEEWAQQEDYDGFVYPATLWFLNDETCSLLEGNLQYMDFTLQSTTFSDGLKPVMIHTWLSNSSYTSVIYVVEAGVPKQIGELECARWGENDTIVESKLVREMLEDGSMPITGEQMTSYKYEQGELVLQESWFVED